MAEGSQESFEGRLIAHRKLLSAIVAALSEAPAGDRLRDFLDEASIFRDSEEDPGVAPTAANAILLAQAEEIRLIAERAKGSLAGV